MLCEGLLLLLVSRSVCEKTSLWADEPDDALLCADGDLCVGARHRAVDSSMERRMDSGVTSGESGSRKLRGLGRGERGGNERRGLGMAVSASISPGFWSLSGCLTVDSLSLELPEPVDLDSNSWSAWANGDGGDSVSGVRRLLRPLSGSSVAAWSPRCWSAAGDPSSIASRSAAPVSEDGVHAGVFVDAAPSSSPGTLTSWASGSSDMWPWAPQATSASAPSTLPSPIAAMSRMLPASSALAGSDGPFWPRGGEPRGMATLRAAGPGFHEGAGATSRARPGLGCSSTGRVGAQAATRVGRRYRRSYQTAGIDGVCLQGAA